MKQLWHVQRHVKPIPSRSHDWDYVHDDYDGAPDAGDNRHGTARSLTEAILKVVEAAEPGKVQISIVATVVDCEPCCGTGTVFETDRFGEREKDVCTHCGGAGKEIK